MQRVLNNPLQRQESRVAKFRSHMENFERERADKIKNDAGRTQADNGAHHARAISWMSKTTTAMPAILANSTTAVTTISDLEALRREVGSLKIDVDHLQRIVKRDEAALQKVRDDNAKLQRDYKEAYTLLCDLDKVASMQDASNDALELRGERLQGKVDALTARNTRLEDLVADALEILIRNKRTRPAAAAMLRKLLDPKTPANHPTAAATAPKGRSPRRSPTTPSPIRAPKPSPSPSIPPRTAVSRSTVSRTAVRRQQCVQRASTGSSGRSSGGSSGGSSGRSSGRSSFQSRPRTSPSSGSSRSPAASSRTSRLAQPKSPRKPKPFLRKGGGKGCHL